MQGGRLDRANNTTQDGASGTGQATQHGRVAGDGESNMTQEGVEEKRQATTMEQPQQCENGGGEETACTHMHSYRVLQVKEKSSSESASSGRTLGKHPACCERLRGKTLLA